MTSFIVKSGLFFYMTFLFACGEVAINEQDFSDLPRSVTTEMREKLKLARDGDKDAQMLLSHMYLGRMDNDEYPLDQKRGVYWLEQFADNQHPLILERTADMFYYGDLGVEKDITKALHWYKQAANAGSGAAMDQLGIFHSNGYANLEQSCEKAVEWFVKSRDAGYKFADNNIAWEYATCPFDDFRDGEKALSLALEVVQNDSFDSSTHLDTLAAAYAENDDFENAVISQRKALGLIDKDKSKERFEEFLNRLKVYKRGEKWREPLKTSDQSSNKLVN